MCVCVGLKKKKNLNSCIILYVTKMIPSTLVYTCERRYICVISYTRRMRALLTKAILFCSVFFSSLSLFIHNNYIITRHFIFTIVPHRLRYDAARLSSGKNTLFALKNIPKRFFSEYFTAGKLVEKPTRLTYCTAVNS